ncbi:hypothetical protein BSR29_00610 [Boudabousia liubingyangii]|uniref:YwiC-like family protein n=1 Tax=Boudabousia liubingyangii TaxID=1921764 RepID=A0A1Q5PPG9_9ACTO|nr:YwiC-like family protein [Boudabousia liubingyangii]OKL49498.1 hypothetical protein BSR29_00610 [Boudabousia liubingyangii]
MRPSSSAKTRQHSADNNQEAGAERKASKSVKTARPAKSASGRGLRDLPGLSKRSKKAWIPDQHGAWAMLILPLLFGGTAGGWAPSQLLLALTALSGFLAWHAGTIWWRARNRAPYALAFYCYTGFFVFGALLLLGFWPKLWQWAIFSPIAILLLALTFRRQERSGLARFLVVSLCLLLAPAAFDLGSGFAHQAGWWPWWGGAWPHLWAGTALMTLYFWGTVPYVKTLIRERRSDAWLRFSIAYHAVTLLLVLLGAWCSLWGWWALVLAVVWLTRAVLFPLLSRGFFHDGRPRVIKPVVIGVLEIVLSALLALGWVFLG